MKLLRNITLGASMLLANQACTSVNQAHKTENSTSLTFEQKIESGSKTEQLLKTLRGMGLSINNIQGLQIGSDSSSESFVFTSSNHSKFDQDFLNTAYKKLGYLIFKINTDQKTFYIALNKSEFLSLKNSNPCLIDESDLNYYLQSQNINSSATDSFEIDSQWTVNSFYFEVYKQIVRSPNLETLLKDILIKTKYTPIIFHDYDDARLIAIAVDVSEVLDPIDHSVVNQITSETCKQLDVELSPDVFDPLNDFIKELEFAGFEIDTYEEFIDPMYGPFNGFSRQEIEELRGDFLPLPNSAFLLVSKSSLDMESKLRELLKIAKQSDCFVGIVDPDITEDQYKINVFCGKDIKRLKR